MTARLVLRLVLLAAAFAAGTMVAGWWALTLLGAVWGVLNRGRRWVGVQTAVSAALAWGALLIWTSTVGPFALLVQKISGVMGLSAPLLYAMTLGFAALVAGAAAGFAASLPSTGGPVGSRAG